jgi:hypothetical protein
MAASTLGPIAMRIDASKMEAQNAQLKTLLEQLPEGGSEHARSLCLGYFERMHLDIVFGDHITTPVAGGGLQIVQACWLGVEFENLLAALGAGNA